MVRSPRRGAVVGVALLFPVLPLAAPGARAAEVSLAEATERISPEVADREGWATDALAALDGVPGGRSLQNLCAVYTIVDVTSGFEPSPRLDRRRAWNLDAVLVERYGEFGAWLIRRLLAFRDPATGRTFTERIAAATYERDLDLAFRDFVAAGRARRPRLAAEAEKLLRRAAGVDFGDLHPIGTVGPMQVSVAWAAARLGPAGVDRDEARRLLASRRGGLVMGTDRLLGWDHGYRNPRFLLMDYVSGRFSCRNAAFQARVAELSGRPLRLDGDLVAYGPDGVPRDASETLDALRSIRDALPGGAGLDLDADVRRSASREFEESATYRAVTEAWTARTGKELQRARVPELRARPGRTQAYSTRQFARSVMRHYRACLDGRPLPLRQRRPTK